jgi:hypothetical protein
MPGPRRDVKRDVKYLNKDFSGFRNDLIDYAKTYFPNSYNDFNETSPGMMFIEMASYVGDVLSYYIDNQFKESLLAFAEEKRTVYEIAQSLGYTPTLSSPSTTDIDLFQTVPSTGTGDSVRPDMDYALTLSAGVEIQSSTTGKTFRTLEDVNFKFSSSLDPMTVDIYETSTTDNTPTKYLLKKSTEVVSGEIKEENHTFGSATQYDSLVLSTPSVVEVISVTDSDNNTWYEVSTLAQDTIFDEMETNSSNDPDLAQFSGEAAYLLKLRKTPRRFVTFIRPDERVELRFGAGVSDNPDEEIVPNPDSVGSSLPGGTNKLDSYFDPSNFLKTRTYGLAPANTTLTVKYSYGAGVEDNVPQGDVVNISNISYVIDVTGLNAGQVQTAKDSVAATNPEPATGGRGAESIKEVKDNALAYFQAQGRAVTKEDYITRAYALPPRYGNIAKAYIVQDEQLQLSSIKGEVTDAAALVEEEPSVMTPEDKIINVQEKAPTKGVARKPPKPEQFKKSPVIRRPRLPNPNRLRPSADSPSTGPPRGIGGTSRGRAARSLVKKATSAQRKRGGVRRSKRRGRRSSRGGGPPRNLG